MTWIPLLLADPSPSFRILVLKNLLGKTEDNEEVKELREIQEQDPILENILKFQLANGSWDTKISGDTAVAGNIQFASQNLVKLAYLDYPRKSAIIERAVEYIFSHQNTDGSWPLPKAWERNEEKGYDMQPLQTIVPLEGIAAVGYAQDERAELAFEWLLQRQLEDGAWPVGIKSGVYGGIGGYRSIAHSRWGCRSTTIGALNCFSYHPKRRVSKEAKRALDLTLGCETKAELNLGFDISRLIGIEPSRGWITYYPRLDPAHILKLCSRIEASIDDPRVESLVNFVQGLQNDNGLWECKLHPQATRWLTYDLLNSITVLKSDVDWVSHEPRTPFQEYTKKLNLF
jgi:hypothetical protein